jgi:hypothetical protein
MRCFSFFFPVLNSWHPWCVVSFSALLFLYIPVEVFKGGAGVVQLPPHPNTVFVANVEELVMDCFLLFRHVTILIFYLAGLLARSVSEPLCIQ